MDPAITPSLDGIDLRAERAQAHAQLRAHLRAGLSGFALTGWLANWLDSQLARLIAALNPHHPPPPLSLYATGSYGQRLIAPRSDLDLLVVYAPDCDRAQLEAWVVAFQAALRAGGWKVALASRTPQECLDRACDETIAASMLDARLLTAPPLVPPDGLPWEPSALRLAVADQLRTQRGGLVFARAVRDGCIDRHRRVGSTAYHLEPDLKRGRGSLRDRQALAWSALVLHGVERLDDAPALLGIDPQEALQLRRATDLLLRVRVALHLSAATAVASDRLTYPHQRTLTDLLPRLHDADDPHAPYRRALPPSVPPSRELLPVERFMQALYAATDTLATVALRWQDIWLLPADEVTPVPLNPGLCVRQRAVDLLRLRDRPSDRALPQASAPALHDADTPHASLDPLHPSAERLLLDNPLAPLEAALDLDLPLHPIAQAHLARAARARLTAPPAEAPDDRSAAASLLRILTAIDAPDDLIQAVASTGLLYAFLPELLPLRALALHDVYHVYTVDAHLIHALNTGRRLLRVALGRPRTDNATVLPEAAAPFRPLAAASPAHRAPVLLLACLLHDIGKGRGVPHAPLGAQLARAIAPRLGLTPAQTDHLALLILHHALLARVSQQRDLDDPQTLREVARTLRTRQALDDLTLLTVIDTIAVGPDNLTPWKAQLLLDLHRRTRRLMDHGLDAPWFAHTALSDVHASVKAHLPADLAERLPALFDALPSRYLLATPAPVLAQHLGLFARTPPEGVALAWFERPERACSELVVCAPARPGILADLTGTLSAHRLDILAADIHTTEDGLRVLDTFAVRTSARQPLSGGPRRDRLDRDLYAALRGELDVAGLVARSRPRLPPRPGPPVPTLVTIDPSGSGAYTMIEVRARDQAGLLWCITDTLRRARYDVHLSKIATQGRRVIDVFYVLPPPELPRPLPDDALRDLRARLLNALRDLDPEARVDAPRAGTLP